MDTPRARYDVHRLVDDMALRGWRAADLARCAGVSEMTVHRFLSGKVQTPRTALKLAQAVGYSVRRYFISSREEVA